MPHPRKEEAAERERVKKVTTRLATAAKAEDAKWADEGDKGRKAREARQVSMELKAEDLLRKQREKQDLIRLEEEEAARIGKGKKLAGPTSKVKQSEIRISALSSALAATKKKAPIVETIYDQELKPNPNKVVAHEEILTGIKTEAGTGTIGAISALSSALGGGKMDAHPERRMKTAHLAFEERRLKELQLEKPGLKRSQYKEMIWKEWLKSPENPMVDLNSA